MTTTADLLTLEDYATLDEDEGAYTSEVVRGRVVREPRPGRLHGRIQVRIAQALANWCTERAHLEAGASLVWIVDPKAEAVTVYRPDGSASLLRDDATLHGEAVPPGFSLGLEELFAPPG